MNYSKQIRETLKQAEFINVRGEVSIPLYRLKKELEKRNIPQNDFKEYLFTYASRTDRPYIEEVVVTLYGNDINPKENFRITSGLR